CWSGPNHNMTATPSGQKLVDDLDQARLVWRSQQAIGLSQGHFSHPYFDHLFAQPTCGGGAAPIVADGKVFATQWFPDGKEYDAEGLKKLQDAAAQWGLKEPTPAMKLHVSKTCHDWYVCMDAATGQTLWTAEFPEEAGMYYGNSHPDHKGGPTGLTPCYANGKLFGLHLSGYLRAMDAKTGKLLWKQKVAGNVPQGRGNCNCVMFIGGVVMVVGVGGINACDPETGAILWKGGGDAVADPQRLVLDGKEYAFTKTHEGKSYSCLDPKTGKELWNLGPQPGGTLLGFTFWINGDTVAVLEGKDAKVDPVKNWQGSVSIVLYRLTPQKAEKVWEVPAPGPLEGRWASVMAQEKYVAVFSNALSSDKAWLLDRATGKEVAVTKVSGPENHGFVEVAEDRFFVKPDGVHGGIHFSMMGATPETFKVMGKEGWGPKFPHASSYAYKPTTMPIVDGRMYFRGADGIYCYDLRKTPAMLKVETALEGAKASDGAAIDKGDLQVANRSLAMIRSLKPDEAVRILGDALKGDKPW
ncbi:MAG: PQQ-binding-like beta-propeller repeat protein, partial [Thermoguttaceae bacterium]